MKGRIGDEEMKNQSAPNLNEPDFDRDRQSESEESKT